jgi:hypothetical protein
VPPRTASNRSGLAPARAELARCPLEVNGPIEKLPPPYDSDLGAGGKQGVRLLGKRERVSIRIGDLHVTDSVRVGLDRFVLDPLGGEAFEECVEPGDGESDPARARLRRVRLDEKRGMLLDLPEDLVPTRPSAGRPKNRVYQSMLASRSDTGTPAKRSVVALCMYLVRF